MTDKLESEFGKGLAYPLGLFLAHAERMDIGDSSELWFNGASDHLYELNTEIRGNKTLSKRLNIFRDKVLGWGHRFPKKKATKTDKEWAVQEAKDLLFLIDGWIGQKPMKGSWE